MSCNDPHLSSPDPDPYNMDPGLYNMDPDLYNMDLFSSESTKIMGKLDAFFLRKLWKKNLFEAKNNKCLFVVFAFVI